MIVRRNNDLRKFFGYALFLSAIIFVIVSVISPVRPAKALTNPTINFQGRLLTSSGATVPDGFYNIQFKIYQDGDGLSANDATGTPAGTLKWTENWMNNTSQGVTVKNGYMSVELGRINPFGSQVDWDQDTLWLSINIGNTNLTCTPITSCALDGEMLPMKRFSSTPYAMNAGKLGGFTAAGFIQNTTTLQSANIAVQSAAAGNIAAVISGAASQSVDIFQVKASGVTSPLFTIGNTGKVAIQPASDATDIFTIKTALGTNTVFSVDTQNSRVTVGNATTTGTGLTANGAISSTTGYQIGGVNTLTGTALTFTGAGAATIQSAQNQTLSIQGGSASVAGTNGANLTLSGGAGSGSGVVGLVTFNPSVFTASAQQNLGTDTTLTGLVNTSSTIPINATVANLKVTVPIPTTATIGRILYITATSASNDFSLYLANTTGGTDPYIVVGMRKNNTATLIWNGYAWTAAGASSSTDLQSAYNNTLQSAGGAELVVSHPTSNNTNGLTIRDSTLNPVNGALLTVQSSSAANLFSVNSNVTEYATDAGSEVGGGGGGVTDNTFPASTWTGLTSTTISRYTTAGNFIATGQGSVSANVTAATANAGVKNQLSGALTANMHYNVSFTTRLASGTFTDMNVYYSVDGTAASVACTTTATTITSAWTKVNCAFTAPSAGITANNAILIRQTTGVIRTFYVDNLSVTIAADYNLATDPGVDDNTNYGANWSFVNATSGVGSSTRNILDGNDASDSAGVTLTTGAANAGIRNKLSMNPLPSTLYRISVYAKLLSGTFTDFKIRYSRDGSTASTGNYVDCADYNTQTITTTGWTKITCYVTTDATTATNPYVNFVETASLARTFYVDTFSMTLSSNTTPNVQIGSGVNGGPTTLFTVDKGASAPIAANNDALLGSMYYDTTLGKLQCYEADGWGACGSSPDNIITISPEYTNAVLHGTGIGTMTSDLCSDYLGINDGTGTPAQPTICSAGETYNFYKWTSPQATAQAYSIYVTYQLPSTFKSFNSGQTSLQARVDNTSNAFVKLQIYKNHGGLSTCGSDNTITTSANTWQSPIANGTADPSTCGFAPGDSIVFKITASARATSSAYIGNLNFAFSNK